MYFHCFSVALIAVNETQLDIAEVVGRRRQTDSYDWSGIRVSTFEILLSSKKNLNSFSMMTIITLALYDTNMKRTCSNIQRKNYRLLTNLMFKMSFVSQNPVKYSFNASNNYLLCISIIAVLFMLVQRSDQGIEMRSIVNKR